MAKKQEIPQGSMPDGSQDWSQFTKDSVPQDFADLNANQGINDGAWAIYDENNGGK
jgi:hypothetical protein